MSLQVFIKGANSKAKTNYIFKLTFYTKYVIFSVVASMIEQQTAYSISNTMTGNSRIVKTYRELLVGGKQMWKESELAFE